MHEACTLHRMQEEETANRIIGKEDYENERELEGEKSQTRPNLRWGSNSNASRRARLPLPKIRLK